MIVEFEGTWITTKSGKRFFAMKPLHEKHGSKKNVDGSIDMSDPTLTAKIAGEYLKKISSGEMKILGGSEVDLGGNKYVRTFIIQE
jgi:hypothetical protein